MLEEEIDLILKEFMMKVEGTSSIGVTDKNGNFLTGILSENISDKSLAITSGVLYLSAMKTAEPYLKGLDLILVQFQEGKFFVMEIPENELLLVIQFEEDARFDLAFVHARQCSGRLRDLLEDMDYKPVSSGRLSLADKLAELEDEFREQYRIFFSYTNSDVTSFKIPQIAEYLESHYDNIEVMYFHKSKLAGEDILDYMERGVNWCNVFVWFHSPSAMESEAVKKEYKMAVYLGKKIISITTDFNALPLSARVTWSMLYKDDHEKLCTEIITDLKRYDIQKSKQDW